MPAPKIILDLVERFDRNLPSYRSGQYNETQLRREFLDPFFEALGWDVFNKQGYAEAYKDVVHEDAIQVGGATKAPDYCFRIGGTRKFFVEAKKPSVNIHTDLSPAFQLRRYAWSAGLPLSLLTDFEELAVYDCRSKPDKSEKASTGRIQYLNFRQYPQQWDELAAIFSREAILKGSFDRYAEAKKGKHGTAAVDDAFLAEIECWRELLARNIALRNPQLGTRGLNFAVQMTIDRIIFLRICEDRGIEFYGALQALLNGGQVYERLGVFFQKADQRYNSGLFHFRPEKDRPGSPDALTPALKIDDKPLKEILRGLYYPDSPYEFSVLPADILGQVYEQFLGKVIRLTAGHHAVVEAKPEVKKAGGVYYTPSYIVEYIVRQTVGALLEGKDPRQAAQLKILDLACGSGSFLLGAYQHLLDWHLSFYLAGDPLKWARGRSPAIYQGMGGEWRLTSAEKKRILLNNIYGVDIDPQAVEVTKLSLLLKVLEGENEQTLGKQLSLFQERALPDLGDNIKCGNSLIGPDFYQGQQLALLDDAEESYRINAFDWQAEFPQAFKSGGFDAVIGNPPYVRQEGLIKDKVYFQSRYKCFLPTSDIYVNFLEKGLGLLKKNGKLGMIVSNKWLRAAYGRPLRNYLAEFATVSQVIDLAGLPVFENATVRTVIMICTPKDKTKSVFNYFSPPTYEEFRIIRNSKDLTTYVERGSENLPIDSLSPDGWNFASIDVHRLVEHLLINTRPLTNYLNDKPYFGIKTGFNQAFIIDRNTRDRFLATDPNTSEIIRPIVGGRDIKRYSISFNQKYLIWSYIGVPLKKYPFIFDHLRQFQSQLQNRWDKGNFWWELRACEYYEKFQKPKIIYPDIAKSCRFYLDFDGYFGSNTTYFLPSDDKYLLGILNSKLANFYFTQVCAGLEGGNSNYLRFFGQYMENFPVHIILSTDIHDKKSKDQIVFLVEQITSLYHRLTSAQTPAEKTHLQRQIEAADRQIDALVYELYGLSEEEIKIVEVSR